MKSIWQETANKLGFQPLEKDIKTDVLIVGGGVAGVLCAYMLKTNGIDCVLVEADSICGGVTGNTTAKITVQHGLIYDKLISKYNIETAVKYLKAQQTGFNWIAEKCKEIDCNFEYRDSYVFSRNNSAKIESEVNAYRRIGGEAEFCKTVDLPFDAVAVRVKNQAQFNPLKFCYSLAKEISAYENTKVLEFFNGGAVTNRGKIYAQNIIMATHFPIINKHGAYFLKMYQHRSYVLALENAKLPNGMYVDENLKGLSFREYDGKLLLGGGSHRTGKKGGAWQELEAFANKNYPHCHEVTRWATQDCMTLDSISYIGRYSRRTHNLYAATGFNKWGMTNAAVSAIILCDMIMGKTNEFAEVFSPSRSILHPQLAVNIAETTLNMLTPTVPRCSHLGCALKYNKAERSWDCACHGSRFTENGKLIENPATDDKKF